MELRTCSAKFVNYIEKTIALKWQSTSSWRISARWSFNLLNIAREILFIKCLSRRQILLFINFSPLWFLNKIYAKILGNISPLHIYDYRQDICIYVYLQSHGGICTYVCVQDCIYILMHIIVFIINSTQIHTLICICIHT